MALTGSTKPPGEESDKELCDRYQSADDGRDPRIVRDLDPRLTSMAEKVLQPLMNTMENKEDLFKNIEEDPMHCQFEPTQQEEMTINQAKRILKKTVGMKKEKKEAKNHREFVEEKKEVKMTDFNIDNFRKSRWND